MGTKFSWTDDGGRDRSFDVAFNYQFSVPVRLGNRGANVVNRDVTLAFIVENFESGKETTYTGVAVRRPDEPFNKESGRNAALLQALADILNLNDYEIVGWIAAYNKAKYQNQPAPKLSLFVDSEQIDLTNIFGDEDDDYLEDEDEDCDCFDDDDEDSDEN